MRKRMKFMALVLGTAMLMTACSQAGPQESASTAGTVSAAETAEESKAAETAEESKAPAASDWKPDRNVEFILLSGAGSGTDVYARTMTDIISKYDLCDQPITVTYANDGGGMVGITKTVQTTTPTLANHTYTAWTSGSVMTADRNSDLRMKDFRPIAVMCNDTGFLAKTANCRFSSFKEAIEAAKNGDHVVVATGKDDYVITMIDMLAKLGLKEDQMSYMVYDSATQTMASLLGDHVDFALTCANTALEYMAAGQVSAEFICGPDHLEGDLADVPTWMEYTEGAYEDITPLYIWRGVTAPKGMSDEAYDYWCNVYAQVAETPEWEEYCDKYMVENLGKTGDDATAFMLEYEKGFLATLE